ncbi:MAG: PASTA domain-containing protein [Flavobacteriaceae bacterium]|nr:PASTA domain-containing protein [Flavobacteriaceae bacterium]
MANIGWIFLRNLIPALVILVGIVFGLDRILKQYTHHNENLIVPSLNGNTLGEAIKVLQSQNLRFQIIDSSQYIQDLPPLTVLNHIPGAESKVKKNRLIYLTINRSSQPLVTLPNLIQVTIRNARSIIGATGLKLGSTTYVDNIGKDMILEVTYKGQEVQPGFRLPKGSSIDLVLGNGKQ